MFCAKPSFGSAKKKIHWTGAAELLLPFIPKSLLSACKNRKRPFFLGLSCSGGGGDSAAAGADNLLPSTLVPDGGEERRGGVTARRLRCWACSRGRRLARGGKSVGGSPSLRRAHDRPGRVGGGALLVRRPVLVVGRLEPARARRRAPLLVRLLLVGVLLLVLLVLLLRPVLLGRRVAARRSSRVRRGRRVRPLGAAVALRRVDAPSASSHGRLAPQVCPVRGWGGDATQQRNRALKDRRRRAAHHLRRRWPRSRRAPR